jgi:hypothetical protein
VPPCRVRREQYRVPGVSFHHELAQVQKREEHVVVQTEIAFEGLSFRDPGPEVSQVVEVEPELGETPHEVRHPGASFSRLNPLHPLEKRSKVEGAKLDISNE